MSPLHIEVLTSPPLDTNALIVADPDASAALAVDPSCVAERIEAHCAEQGWTIQGVVATHGHIDHIRDAGELARRAGAPLMCHPQAAPALGNEILSGAAMLGMPFDPARPDRTLDDGDVVEVGAERLRVLHTPGHSPGSICLIGEGAAIVGDLLFRDGVGRWDLPGGDLKTLVESLRRLVETVEPEVTVYPGHGPTTTLERERARTPYLLDWLD